MMRARTLGVSLLWCSWGVGVAAGQSFVDRLTEQLQGIATRDAAQETLPPPRDLGTPTAPRVGGPGPVVPGTPSLGIRAVPVTEDVVRTLQLPVRQGAVITAVEKNSPADKAGLPVGGVIVALDGRRIDSPDELARAVRSFEPGRDVELTYYERNRLARKRVHLVPVSAPAVLLSPDETSGLLQVPPPPVSTPTVPAPPVPGSPLPESGARSPSSSPASAESGPRGTPTPLPLLGRQLGGQGSRPLLERLGRMLDGVVAPAGATEPLGPESPSPSVAVPRGGVSPPPLATVLPSAAGSVPAAVEVAALRQQIDLLQQQLDALRRQLENLEKKVADR